MNDEYYTLPSICGECINGNNFCECQLLPEEEKSCLENGALLFEKKEEGK